MGRWRQLKQQLRPPPQPKREHYDNLEGRSEMSSDSPSSRKFSKGGKESWPKIPHIPARSFPCYITEVPPDILLSVTDFLDAASHNALRLTCRGFHTSLKLRKMDVSEDVSFTTWIKKDLFSQTCAQELQQAFPPHLACCAACMTTHPCHLFSPDALHTPPAERLCRGHEKRLRICNHASASLTQLRAALEPSHFPKDDSSTDERVWNHFALCSSSKHPVCPTRTSSQEPFLVVWPSGKRDASTRKPELEIVRFYRLVPGATGGCSRSDGGFQEPFVVKGGVVIGLRRQVMWAASRIREDACPHINLRRLFGGEGCMVDRRKILFQGAPVRSCSISKDCLHPGLAHCDVIAEWKCASPNCDTVIGLYHNVLGELYLGTRRHVGDLEDANDPRWLTQLEAPTRASKWGNCSRWKKSRIDEPELVVART
ncbi:hypothetical protein EV356DRAFT_142892 [Viridothelium virens]|uniref:F-box domain-containing protein n=1 Tax=Viridothelium virens TaxID=1048519 RepID=A0A6A6H9K0_VIRVR|nr:hypothetical protein EV356DRAFT_142892 [Viridothelium virens]